MKPPIRVAMLECDTPLPKTNARYHGYGGVFEALLKAGAQDLGRPDPYSGLQISQYQVELHPEVYPDPQDIDAILITGSSMVLSIPSHLLSLSTAHPEHNSFDDSSWIKTLVSYVAEVLAQGRVRVIGVCFGHQIVGRAMGVKVGRNPDGWESAVHDMQLTAKGKEIFQKDSLVRFVFLHILFLASNQKHRVYNSCTEILSSTTLLVWRSLVQIPCARYRACTRRSG
jgi:GMP synthase-like glutamine amidotransferase